jgi:hypothetical protein
MRTYRQSKDGSGNGPESDFINRLLSRLNQLQFFDSTTIKFSQRNRGVTAHVINPQAGGQANDQWQTPNKELDPTVAVSKGTLVYISPGNSLATTGLTDLVAAIIKTSPAGIWEAAQTVPAQITVSRVVKYNVPQFPYPGATGTPSGTPLAGDLDGANVFWIFHQGASVGMVNYRGVWSGASSYSISDTVSLGSGTSAGFYLSTINNNTNPPDSGIGWVQFSSYATWL